MSYNLVIVESPNKMKNIKGYLESLFPSEKWELAASVGHFCELSKQSGEGYVTAGVKSGTYETDMVVSESKLAVFKKLQALSKNAKTVYLATDADREGEAIADSLKTFLRLKAPVRVLFNEITKAGIKAAMDKPTSIDQSLVIAQQARRVLDRLVGFVVSPELYNLMGVSGVSAGRVQSPVLRLIYERHQSIVNFKPNNYFDVILTGESEGKEFKAKLDSKPFHDENGYFIDQNLAQNLAASTDLKLASFDESDKLKQPPSPLTTSLMQQVASGTLKIKPKEAMQAAQSLFEAGLITYHRTDNPNLSEETYNYIKENFSQLGVMPEQRIFKSKEGSQEGHPAITPTDFNLTDAGSTATEKQLYALIRTYAIASQLLPAKYKVRKATLITNHQGHDVEFNASGSELLESGYLSFIKPEKDDDTDSEDDDTALLPDLNNGFNIISGKAISKKTQPPKLFTIKSLLARLDNLGIGRPATLDAIFETLEQRQYIIIDNKNNLKPTDLGERILLRLINEFEFIEYKFTSDMEKDLDLLAYGKAEYVAVVDSFYKRLSDEVVKLKKQNSDVEVFPCPDCESPLVHRFKKGKGGYDFWGCTNHTNGCKFSADNVNGKPVKKAAPTISEHKCPKCTKPLINRVKKGSYDFFACTGYPDCNYSADNKDGVPVEREKPKDSGYVCTDCSKPLVRRTGKSSKGTDYDFYGCTGFRAGCKKTFQTAEDGTPILDK